MVHLFKNICVAIVLGTAFIWLSDCLESPFLREFLKENLITLLIALLAINVATLSIIISNLKELSENIGQDFNHSLNEMKTSVIEQLVVIGMALISQMLLSSKIFKEALFFPKIEFILNALPACLLVYAIIILWDTSKAIFETVNK